MDPVRIGLIGAGWHARAAHLPALALVPQLRLVAVATGKEQTAREAGEHFRARSYVGHEALLDHADVEAVIISAPTPMHDQITRAALERGKHVLVETPGLTSVEAAQANILLAEQKHLVVQVAFCFRHGTGFDVLRREIADVPPPRLLAFEYFPFVGHIYNLALDLCGPVDRVVGAVKTAAGTTATVRFKSGDTAVIMARVLANCAIDMESVRVTTPQFFGEVTGRRTVRIIRHMQPTPVSDWSIGAAAATVYDAQPIGSRFVEATGYAPQLRAFAAAVRDGVPVRSTLRAAIDTAVLGRMIAEVAAASP